MPSKPGQRRRRPLVWTEPQKQALNLIFEGRKSQATIAGDCGVPLRTLEDWIAHPDFQAKLQERRDNLMNALDDQPYIRKERRLIALAQMAESARVEYEARPWLKEVRPTPDGESVNEHFNKDAHAAFREALTDIAAELGARKNVTELTGKDGGPIEVNDARQRFADKLQRLADIAARRPAASDDDATTGDADADASDASAGR